MAIEQTALKLPIRLVPRKGRAATIVLFALAFLLMLVVLYFVPGGTTTVNGKIVVGEERDRAIISITASMAPLLLALIIWYGRRLIPGSPFDYVQIEEAGLTARDFFKQRHFPWRSITSISYGYVPLFRLGDGPMAWIILDFGGAKPGGIGAQNQSRVWIGGYVHAPFFGGGEDSTAQLCTWLESIRAAQSGFGRVLPAIPADFNDRVAEMPADHRPRTSIIGKA